jgi:Rrf2 family protein
MLSSKAKYALRAAVLLAQRHCPADSSAWVLAPEIAETERIPRKFLEAILVELRDGALLESRRGRYGGYRLARSPAEISAGDVIRVIDGPLALTPCSSRSQFGACADCVDVSLCALRPMLSDARDAVSSVLDHSSLLSLVQARHAQTVRKLHGTL